MDNPISYLSCSPYRPPLMDPVLLHEEARVPGENLRCLVESNWTVLFSHLMHTGTLYTAPNPATSSYCSQLVCGFTMELIPNTCSVDQNVCSQGYFYVYKRTGSWQGISSNMILLLYWVESIRRSPCAEVQRDRPTTKKKFGNQLHRQKKLGTTVTVYCTVYMYCE